MNNKNIDPHVLWVEDDQRFYMTYYNAIEQNDFRITSVNDATKAVHILLEKDVIKTYQLIILDVILPPGEGNVFPLEIGDEERGIEILRKLNELKVQTLPPILFFTARKPELSIEKLKEEGISYDIRAILGKPIDVDKFVKAVKSHVEI